MIPHEHIRLMLATVRAKVEDWKRDFPNLNMTPAKWRRVEDEYFKEEVQEYLWEPEEYIAAKGVPA